MCDTFPSWLFPVRHGATTMWERWNGWTPQWGFQPASMNSFNHCALGAVGEWMYDVIGGIALDPAAPGFRRVVVHPRPGGGVTWARAWHRTIRGVVRTEWRVVAGALQLAVEIPPNMTARVVLPDAAGRDAAIEVGSGEHRFEAALPGHLALVAPGEGQRRASSASGTR
jgi:alpha-L-rhamnosidase